MMCGSHGAIICTGTCRSRPNPHATKTTRFRPPLTLYKTVPTEDATEDAMMAARTYYFIQMENGRLWRYKDSRRPAVFYSYPHAAQVLLMLGLTGAHIVTEDGPIPG